MIDTSCQYLSPQSGIWLCVPYVSQSLLSERAEGQNDPNDGHSLQNTVHSYKNRKHSEWVELQQLSQWSVLIQEFTSHKNKLARRCINLYFKCTNLKSFLTNHFQYDGKFNTDVIESQTRDWHWDTDMKQAKAADCKQLNITHTKSGISTPIVFG